MATKVTMPQLGESVTEGTISQWLVKAGDQVKKYDPLCEVMTDKVNAEVPSSIAGTITEIVAQEGETVEVGGLICYIEEEGAAAEAPQEAVSPQEEQAKPEVAQTADQDQSMKRRYSPAVLKLSQEHGIDLEQVVGSGKGGRITRKDLLKLIESGKIPEQQTSPVERDVPAPEQPVPGTANAAPAVTPLSSTAAGDIEIPVSGVRRAIATKMVQSKHEAPHAWTMIEVDVTDLVAFRSRMKDEFKRKEGVSLTFLPFFIKATVEALKEFPMINSQWAGDKIIQKKVINVSLAVATEDALYVPVIKQADEKSILGLAKAIDQLAEKTRQGKLTTEDMQGGTFTVNNTGSFGSIQSAPIINYPQAAILSVEAIVKRPVIKDGMIAVRDMVNLCMSLDHRILDGLICGRFLQSIKKKLESMGEGTSLY
jgi:2-oxoisovalerate dehydrogenase E2 component (dihydrolipoyl transacylase)